MYNIFNKANTTAATTTANTATAQVTAPATATQATPAPQAAFVQSECNESNKILALVDGYEKVATSYNLPAIEEANARLEQLGFIRPSQANTADVLRCAQLMAWGALNMSIVPYYYGNGTEMLSKNLSNVASKRKVHLEAFKALVPTCYSALLFMDVPLFKQDVVQLLVEHIVRNGLATLAERAEQLRASQKDVNDAKLMALDAILKERA